MRQVELSQTYKCKTSCGNLYITITEQDRLFVNMGKAGGCAYAFNYALITLVNFCLENKLSYQDIVKRLKGISCHLQDTCIDKLAVVIDNYFQEKIKQEGDKDDTINLS